MNIYFAGSIRGGRGDQALYLEIISRLGKYGTVLTEHVGEAAVLEKEKGVSDEAIFAQDMRWLKEADAVIAEVTQPSLGVGYEIGRAEAMGKKILCLYRPKPEKALSAMIAGNPSLVVKEYRSRVEIPGILENFFNQYT